MKGKLTNLVFGISLVITASSLIGCGKGAALMLPSDISEGSQGAVAPSTPPTGAQADAEDEDQGSMPAQVSASSAINLTPSASSMYLIPRLEAYKLPTDEDAFLMLVFSDPADKLTTDKLKAGLKIRKQQMVNGNPTSAEVNGFISCAELQPDKTKACAIIESQTAGATVVHQWSDSPYSYKIILEENFNFVIADSIYDAVFTSEGIDFSIPNAVMTFNPIYPSYNAALAQVTPAYGTSSSSINQNSTTVSDDD